MNQPSLLTIHARCVANCIELLEREGYKPLAISITEHYSLISIDYTASVKKLHGIHRGVIRGKGGTFSVYEVRLHDVHVQWLVPYFDAVQQKRVH